MRIVRRVLRMGAVWLLLSVSLWAAGAACLNKALPASGVSRFSMRFSPKSEPSFDGIGQYYDRIATGADEAEIPGILTAWAEIRNRQLSAAEWTANVAVDIYYVHGNIMDVMDLSLISGGFPASTDTNGISIDNKSAVKLFGASLPIGLDIYLDGKKYTVRGIFECPKGIETLGSDTGRGIAVLSPPPALPAGADGRTSKQVGVQGVEIIFPAGLSPDEARSYAMQLSGAMGLGGAAYTRDRSADDRIQGQLAHFPGWMMMAVAVLMLLYTAYSQMHMMLRMAWRRFRSRHISGKIALNTMLRGILWGVVMLLASACIYLIVRPDFSLPPSYIPTRWSDVDFWPELIRKMIIDRTERNTLPIARPDAVANTLTGWGCVFIAASLVSIYFFNTCLGKMLGRPVSKRLKRRPDEWSHPAAHMDISCYILLLLSAVAPVIGLKLAELLGLRPVISGTALTMQLIPVVMVSVELILRLWHSALWPLRFSPVSKMLSIMRRIPGIHIIGKRRNLEG